MNYDRYAKVLIWLGRIAAVLALFYPMGVYLAIMLLLVTEIFHMVYRFIRRLEEDGHE